MLEVRKRSKKGKGQEAIPQERGSPELNFGSGEI
jgi:hypothetical protein